MNQFATASKTTYDFELINKSGVEPQPKLEKRDADNWRLKCGEIVLLNNVWRLVFVCDFCGAEWHSVITLLRHTLHEHVSLVEQEISELLEGVCTQHPLTKFQQAQPGVWQQLFEAGEDVVNNSLMKSLQAKIHEKLTIQNQKVHRNSVDINHMDQELDSTGEEDEAEKNNESDRETQNDEVSEAEEEKEATDIETGEEEVESEEEETAQSEYEKAETNENATIATKRPMTLEVELIKPVLQETQNCQENNSSSNCYQPSSVRETRPHIQVHRCAICDKYFPSLAYLKVHVRTHTDGVNSCGGGVSTRFLAEKIRRRRLSVASRSKLGRTNLQTPAFAPTAIKRYRCKVCAQIFMQHASLLWHLRKQHWPPSEEKT